MADRYANTLVEKRLKELLARNGVIGGTSAGAAIMSEVMISSGRERPVISQGFGLIDTAIIDQHFVKRNRFRRLKSAVLQHPELIGFGIDEGAAIQYAVGTGRFDIVGSSCVVACVASDDSDQRHNVRVEFFNPGDEFDIIRLRKGEDVPPSFIDFEGLLLGD
jgi:cyanophycinase